MTKSSKEKKAGAVSSDQDETPDTARGIETLTSLVASRIDCESLIARINALLARRCAAKVNTLPHAGDHVETGCKCTGGTGSGDARFMADLIVLIDCSGSMEGRAKVVSDAAAAAVKAASKHCNVDLRIAYMGVEGTWSGTVFTTDHLAYLKALWTPDPAFATDNPPRTDWHANREEGANAVEDLSKYYDWRPDTCRAIFYISDEKLDSGESTPAEDTAAVASAVAAARANDVTVFAHHITYGGEDPKISQDYRDLTGQTGGTAYFSERPSVADYEKMLAEAICASCGRPRCRTVKAPNLEPCVSVSWGDSKCDCFETDDTEIVCITVCNCYANISFTNFRIAGLVVTMLDGSPVPVLPDGTPSVQIVPMGPICFGDIPPCRDDRPGCISREFVIRTRGARGGQYQVRLTGICYDVGFHYNKQDSFVLTLCSD